MTTLTAAQITLIRLDIGDGCEKLTEAQLQLAYDAAGGDQCTTNAILSRWLWMGAKTNTITLINGGQSQGRTQIDVYEDRYNYWAGCSGMLGGAISTTSVYTYRADSHQTSAPSYPLTDASFESWISSWWGW